MRLINVVDLKVGDEIARNVNDSFDHVLLKSGTVIKSDAIIQRLKTLGVTNVYIEDNWSADIFIEPVVSEETKKETVAALAKMDITGVNKCAGMIVDKLSNAPFMREEIANLQVYDDNTYTHSLNVAILAATLGIHLGYTYDRLKNITAGSILHDIGKRMVPNSITNKPDRLTEEEMAIMKRHAEDGYQMLAQNIETTSSMREIAHQHHENWDGSGYPRGLKENEIFELAHVVHICDVWDALTSKRSYKDSYTVKYTANLIQSGKYTQFNPDLVDDFFRYVPVYPKSAEVTLSNGKKALVLENHKLNMLKPTVLLQDKTQIDLRESNLFIID